MGVQNLLPYIQNNIQLIPQQWKVDSKTYYSLSQLQNYKDSDIAISYNKIKKGDINIIVDARSYFHYLDSKVNWFVYDNLSLLKILRKHICLLLSIDNIGQVFFVFNGIHVKKDFQGKVSPKKFENLKKFYNKFMSFNNEERQASLKVACPMPLAFMTFSQYLLDVEKIFDNFHVITQVSDANDFITKLAIDNNGYVISNNSSFYIYNIPKFVNMDSLIFPKYNEKIFTIQYKLYTIDLLTSHLNITKEMLPYFASLCGNDYLNMMEFPEFSNQLSTYESMNKHDNNNITNSKFKNIIDFLLDINDDINNDNEKDKQELFIEELLKRKAKETDPELDQKFKNNILHSVKEYNLLNTKKVDTKEFMLSEDIIKSVQSNNLVVKLLNVFIINSYFCDLLFESFHKECAWNVTEDLRKQLYNLLLSRNIGSLKKEINHRNDNEIDISAIPGNYSILERFRKGTDMEENSVEIKCDDTSFPETMEDSFTTYLRIFNSDIPLIRELPYYLIPITITLRYFLIHKVKTNSFRTTISNDDQTKGDNDTESSKTMLNQYELQALLASCIASLTLSYLNKEFYSLDKQKTNNKEKTFDSSLSLEQNIQQNYKNCNLFYLINDRNPNKRSLQLKSTWGIKDFHKNKELYENSLQIYAEFMTLLYVNSNIIQTLKLSEYHPEFKSFYSMNHYIWEEAFYSMIEPFKTTNNAKEGISTIFNRVFTPSNNNNNSNDNKKLTENYSSYLNDVYFKMYNAVTNF